MNKQNDTLFNRCRRAIRFLIEPPPNITDIQQKRQARLLSALLLIIILLGSLSGIIQLLLVPGFFPTFVVVVGGVAILWVAYILTRTKYYLVAATLASLTPFIASYAALRTNSDDQSAFVFMLLSVLLSSILLNRWLTVGIAALNILGLLFLPYIQPGWSYSIVAGKISFHIIISALIVIAMWHRDLVEGDRQEELRASELKFRSIFDNSLDAIGVFKAGMHIMVNPAYVKMFGCESADRLAGRSILDFIAPSERAKIKENLRRRMAGEKVPTFYETRGLRCDGTEFAMEVNVSTYKLGGEPYTVPILRDITRRKKTEDALRASEIRYRAIVETTTDLICRFLPDTTLTFVNEAYCRYFGQSREQLIGTPFLALIPENEHEAVKAHVNHIIQSRKPFTYSHEVITPNGEIRWQQWTDSTILNASGEVVELQSVGRDITDQKLTEEALWQFKSTLDQTQDCVFMFTGDTLEFFYLNQGAVNQVGYTEEELFQMHPYDIKPEFPEPQFRALIKPLVDNVLPNLRLETIHRHKDGHHIPVEILLQYISLTGERGRFIAIVRDITERRRVEEKLRISEERYRILAQNLPDSALLLYDQHLRFIVADGPEIGVMGLSREILEEKTLQEALPGGFATLMEPNMRRTLAGEKFSVELPYEDLHYRYSFVPLRDSSGNVALAMILATNITQLKQVENALKDSQRRLSTALRATKVGVWEWDMRTNKAYWSDENYRVLGLEPGSIESKYENWANCLLPVDLPAADAKVTEAMNNRSELNIEFRVAWPDGSIHWINDIGNILMDETGQPLGMYGIQMDVTERKHAEEEREALIRELEAKNAELERFTYTVSHDLKSPLVTIKGFLGFLEQDIASGNAGRLRDDIKRINNAVKRMEQLLRELLELSRIGRLINPSEEIRFEELAREGLEIVHGRLEAHGITVHIQPNLPIVYGDRQRLIEVLQNLLDNAAKYMGDQAYPRIEIGQRGEENGNPVFYVRDNGIGIAPEHHERIFGLFNKLDAHSEGTGVGLALVKRIVEVHGGRIWVESASFPQGEAGRGSTFLFTLPPAGQAEI
jgi:PAS domain S-box-containing protein